MSWRQEWSRARAIAWKDLTAERRTRVNLNSVIFLAALTLLLFGFAIGPDPETIRASASGMLWLTVLFSGVLVFNRSYQLELDDGALELLLLYPGDRRSIFLGKLAANLALVLLVQAVVLPLAAVLYDLPLIQPVRLGGVFLLGTFGFVSLGTFYAAMTSRTRAREVLLPLLLFPMLVPVLLAAVQATRAILTGDAMGESGSWIRLLVVFDVIFFVAALHAFEHIIEE